MKHPLNRHASLPDPNRRECDFANLPSDQAEHCYFYEFARTCDRERKRVLSCRTLDESPDVHDARKFMVWINLGPLWFLARFPELLRRLAPVRSRQIASRWASSLFFAFKRLSSSMKLSKRAGSVFK